MILTLEIINSEEQNLGARRRKVFNATGGSIGRAPDSDWALPDPFISSHHAVIKYQRGVFSIEDAESKNGVFVNSPENRLAKGQSHALKSGDLILIDPYEITASIAGEPASESVKTPASPPPIPDGPFTPYVDRQPPFIPPLNEDIQARSVADSSEEVDPLAWLPDPNKRADKDVRRASDLHSKPVVSEHYAPPKPVRPQPVRLESERVDAAAPLIPDNWLDDSSELPPAKGDSSSPSRRHVEEGRPATPPVAPPSNPAVPAVRHEAARGELQAVLEGAGLENVAVTPELAHDFGEILRIVVAGLIDVLQAREEVKRAFGIPGTIFKRAENNPLKHSVNVEDALHNLLVKRNPAYLGPVDAFDDAFGDVRNHQVAMLAGFRAAFDTMLAEFDPDRLQAEFDRHVKKASLIPAPSKLRYWDQYREKIHDMVRDSETTFRELFGEEFARTYEEQLNALKAQGRASKRRQGR